MFESFLIAIFIFIFLYNKTLFTIQMSTHDNTSQSISTTKKLYSIEYNAKSNFNEHKNELKKQSLFNEINNSSSSKLFSNTTSSVLFFNFNSTQKLNNTTNTFLNITKQLTTIPNIQILQKQSIKLNNTESKNLSTILTQNNTTKTNIILLSSTVNFFFNLLVNLIF